MKKTAYLLIAAALFLSTSAMAAPKIYGDAVVSEATSIYDGDTFRCNIAGYPAIVGERIGIRINGIDTPEMRDNRPRVKALARKAKQYAVQRLREGRQIVLRNMRRGNFGSPPMCTWTVASWGRSFLLQAWRGPMTAGRRRGGNEGCSVQWL